MTVDCGTGAYILFSSQDNVSGTATLNGFNVYVPVDGLVSMPCSSIIDVIISPNVAYILQPDISFLVFQFLLLGLAGLICGALVAYSMVKYAV